MAEKCQSCGNPEKTPGTAGSAASFIDTCRSCGKRVCRGCQKPVRDDQSGSWSHKCPMCGGNTK
jgi:hypothetical protein